jgi:hypothetical protein
VIEQHLREVLRRGMDALVVLELLGSRVVVGKDVLGIEIG